MNIIKEYTTNNGFNTLVAGVSGVIDSAVAIAKKGFNVIICEKKPVIDQLRFDYDDPFMYEARD